MRTLQLLCVGRTKSGLERDLLNRYLERAKQAGRPLGLTVAVQEIGESSARRPEDRKVEEAEALRGALPPDATRVMFDERGCPCTSAELAALVRASLDSARNVSFVIGGPDGLDPSLRASPGHVVALGAMTWPHQLVRIMVAEQIYRSITILSGHPYHRA